MTTVVAEQKFPQPENGVFFFFEGSSLSFSVSVVLIQVNCLLCIINFLLSQFIFIAHF